MSLCIYTSTFVFRNIAMLARKYCSFWFRDSGSHLLTPFIAWCEGKVNTCYVYNILFYWWYTNNKLELNSFWVLKNIIVIMKQSRSLLYKSKNKRNFSGSMQKLCKIASGNWAKYEFFLTLACAKTVKIEGHFWAVKSKSERQKLLKSGPLKSSL